MTAADDFRKAVTGAANAEEAGNPQEREQIIARTVAQLVAAIGARQLALGHQRAQLDEEVAEMELADVAPTSLLPVLVLEARRRAAFVTELFQRTAWNGPPSTPYAAGLRSVAADVAAGRLP